MENDKELKKETQRDRDYFELKFWFDSIESFCVSWFSKSGDMDVRTLLVVFTALFVSVTSAKKLTEATKENCEGEWICPELHRGVRVG